MSDDELIEAKPTAEAPEQGGALADRLLHEPIPDDDAPGRRWAYPAWAMLLVSLFVLYHTTVLLVHNLPSGGLSKGLHTWFNKHAHMSTYMRATGNTQSWAMFAPNPHRGNTFMRVFVKDKDGEVWDLKHDIYGRRSYPYMFYDRIGKINRRIVDQKGYRRYYAAWVCRDWERTHGGESADEVQFVKLWTQVPPPEKVFAYRDEKTGMPGWFVGYDPMGLHLHQREEEVVRCATTRQAQLPNELRARHGLPEAPENHFLPLQARTWWHKEESKARAEERRKAREEVSK
jgi:hypothetical protein